MMSETVAPHSPQPWYRYGYVWLVISGPLAVVLAGLGTAWLALAYPDPQVAADHFRRGASAVARNLASRG